MRHLTRPELALGGLQVELTNNYTTRGALFVDQRKDNMDTYMHCL